MLRKYTKNGYELLTYAGTAIKATKDRRFEGYLIAYSPPAPIDLHGQHFSAKTERMPEVYPVEGMPILFNHGFDPKIGSFKLGLFDFAREDEKGIFVNGVLKRHEEYIETLAKMNARRSLNFNDEQIERAARSFAEGIDYLLAENVLSLSSGARPPDVRVAPNGHIDVWLLEEGSTTEMPAAPKGTAIAPVKSLLSFMPSYAKTAVDVFEALKEVGGLREEQDDKDESGERDGGSIQIIDLRPHTNQTESLAGDDTTAAQKNAVASTSVIIGVKNMDELIKRLQELLAMLQEQAGGDSSETMPEAERAALIAQATPARSAEDKDKDPTEEEVKAAEQVVAKGFFEHRKKVAQKSADKARQTRKRALELQAQYAPLNPASDSAAGNFDIEVLANHTKWDDMSVEDMSYAFQFLNGAARIKSQGQNSYHPGEDFLPALASKMSDAAKQNPKAFTQKHLAKLQNLIGLRLDGMREMSAVKSHIKANELLHTGQTGYGAEWIPELWLAQLQKQARVENDVLPQFTSINMTSDPFDIPLEGSDPEVKTVREATAVSELTDGSGNIYPMSKPSTGKAQLASGKLGLRVGFSAEAEEDAIIPFAASMREKGTLAMREAIDYVLLNADNDLTAATTTNINYYGGAALPDSEAKYLVGWDGILVYPLNNVATYGVSAAAAAPTLAMIRSLQSKLPARYGNIKDLVIFCDYRTSIALKNISQLETLEKYGPNATVLKGEVGRIDNIPVIMTAQLELAHTDGRVSSTGANNTKGRLIMMNKRNRWVGWRRQPTVTVEYVGRYDAYIMWASMRIAYTGFDNQGVAVLYNILV